MGKIQRISGYADRIAGFLVIALFSIMILSSVLQVFTRYVLNDSLSWTEELARYTFIWANLLAASFCVRNNSHAQINVIYEKLPPKVKNYFTLVIQMIVVTVASVMIVQGIKVMEITKAQLSPALKMHISLVYLAIPVSGFFIIIYSLINIIIAAKGISEKEESL